MRKEIAAIVFMIIFNLGVFLLVGLALYFHLGVFSFLGLYFLRFPKIEPVNIFCPECAHQFIVGIEKEGED